MNSLTNIITISTVIGLGTAATTFMGNMIYPNIIDWRDLSPKNLEIGVARELK